MKLLALDTSTDLCSAAVWLDGALSAREATRQRGHGELILPMIEELLLEAGIGLAQLDAIAFGRGPGGFTGVRLAAGVAQGLAFAATLPMLPISDLRALAAQGLSLAGACDIALVCQDARMQEVYWGCFERLADDVRELGAEAVAAPGEVTLPPGLQPTRVCGVGSGFAAYAPQLAAISAGLPAVFADLRPRAIEVAWLAARDGLERAVAPDQAQPVYLRDDVAQPGPPT